MYSTRLCMHVSPIGLVGEVQVGEQTVIPAEVSENVHMEKKDLYTI